MTDYFFTTAAFLFKIHPYLKLSESCPHCLKPQWLRAYLVVHSNEGVVRRESAGGPLPVHQQCPLLPVHHVLFHFGNVVRNIIDHVQVQVIRGCVEDLGESLRGKA